MNQRKRISFILLAGFGVFSMIVAVATIDTTQSNKASFAGAFQLAGKAPQALSRAVTKVIPVDSVDEGELGQKLRDNYAYRTSEEKVAKEEAYLSFLLTELVKHKEKPFTYSVHLLESDIPNAMALPGGVVLVTRGLLNTLGSEGELMAVLAHEMGHIELNHCFDSVKFELLSRKLGLGSLGEISDFAGRFLFSHSFSKTQEDEADSYSFTVIKQTSYDPTSVARAFKSLGKYSGLTPDTSINPIRDYFQSHPSLGERVAKFSTESKRWWRDHEEKRYLGVMNLKDRIEFGAKDYGESEWVKAYVE